MDWFLNGIQIIALLFGLGMLYMTYTSYKRKQFNTIDFGFWAAIWVVFLFAAIFPFSLKGIVYEFGIGNLIDFTAIIALIVAFGLLFLMYRRTKNTSKKVEEIVEKLALGKK